MIVSSWLEQLGLGQYVQAFAANEIDPETLLKLTSDDLKEIGIAPLAHRKKILEGVALLNLRAVGQPAEAQVLARSEQVTNVAAPLTSKHREAERRQLTVIFIDLVGSTELATQLDPEEMSVLLRQFQNAVAGDVVRFDGYVAKLMGDGALAYFGWPQAHEDEAERAVRAGLAVVGTVGELSTHGGHRLEVRVGIATGVVVVGDLIGIGAAQESAVVGETPNLAARLQSLADPGTVLISELTYRLTGRIFDVKRIRPQKLHGFEAPINSYQVVGENLLESRFDALHVGGASPLVGREIDIALLLERWKLARAGEGQVVELFGEGGIGKSRLLQELRDRLKEERITYLRYFCSPYHTQTELYPVADQLLRAAEIRRSDPPERQLAFLEEVLATTRNPREAIPLIASMLSIPLGQNYAKLDLMPQMQRTRTFEVLIDQLVALAGSNPVLMLLEDAHHLDPTSAELFDAVVDRIRRLPIMLVATYRPEGTARWSGLPHVTTLTLNRLSRAQAASIIGGLTGGKRLPTSVLEQILAKTEGVPLFVEELTKVMLESGLLSEHGDNFKLSGPLPPRAVPATLHDSLMARLDRLASVREVAQIGAVIGREFSHELLSAVSGLPDTELDLAADQLVGAGLVSRRGGGNQRSYAFKHALVQDAAYGSLLHSRRQQLHALIARAIEERFPETVSTEPEILAHHFEQAGLLESASEYQELAGRRALARSLLTEAVARFNSALVGLNGQPRSVKRARRELAIQIAIGSTQVAAHGFASPEAGAAYKRAEELCLELDDVKELFPVLYGLCLFHLYSAELSQARMAADRLLDLAGSENNQNLSFFAHRAAGVSAYPAGEFLRARAHLKEALSLYKSDEHRAPAFVYAFDPRVVCLDYLGRTMLPLGFPDQSIAANEEAISEARELGHRNSLALPLFFGGVSRQIVGDLAALERMAAELLIISSEAGFRLWQAGASILQGWVCAQQGRIDEGFAMISDGTENWLKTGAKFMLPYFLGLQAQLQLKLGQTNEALILLSQAQEQVEKTTERWFGPEIIRLQGEVLLSFGSKKKLAAIERFSEAQAAARAQGARFWELRAALDLANADLSKVNARENLATIYSSFTEGSSLPDLKAAQMVAMTAGSA